MVSYELQNVCTGNLNVSAKEYRIVGTIFSDLYNTYKSNSCKMACKSPAYEIVHEYEANYRPSSVRVVILRFDNEVILKSSRFSIGYQTLLTRLGGYIGFGRTVFWLMVGLFGLLKSSIMIITTFKTSTTTASQYNQT